MRVESVITSDNKARYMLLDSVGDPFEPVLKYLKYTEAVIRYKTLVENQHAPGGVGYTPVYLSWIEF
jgi:hypothetical protein